MRCSKRTSSTFSNRTLMYIDEVKSFLDVKSERAVLTLSGYF